MSKILNLKRRIMARIYFEYTKNTLLEHSDYFMLALFIIVSFTMISIQNVFNNMPKDNPISTFHFLLSALRNTSWIMQALIAGFFIRIIVAGAILAYKNMSKWPVTKLIKLRY